MLAFSQVQSQPKKTKWLENMQLLKERCRTDGNLYTDSNAARVVLSFPLPALCMS